MERTKQTDRKEPKPRQEGQSEMQKPPYSHTQEFPKTANELKAILYMQRTYRVKGPTG